MPSYVRLQPGHWSGAYTAWGIENREAALRFIPGTVTSRSRSANFELKVTDGAANPYLALAATLHAGLSGIEREAVLPEPTQEDPGTLDTATLVARGIRRLPENLGEAAEAFAGSTVLREGLGDLLHDVDHRRPAQGVGRSRGEVGGGAHRHAPVRVLTRFAANVSFLSRSCRSVTGSRPPARRASTPSSCTGRAARTSTTSRRRWPTPASPCA